ncbi:hypothetical protein K7X08_012570 [Anisodus acutangulus]|uniref:Uncharacterized protein n=1 Tax=Anisodus acutangulus TaxID=402998 RepID=A0A9Q1LBM2_9SOLA|nr:hypothetical protein K7X08_012570 [Anisodus acutangulus]
MKRIINQMKEDSCECHDSIFVNVIRSYAQAGLTNEAIFLFKSLPEFNCIEWTRSLITLLEILVEESKLESVYQLFLENSCGWEVKSRAHFLNLLMNVLCRMKRSDLALRIFQEMSYQNCYPNKESYRILMRGLCEEKRLNEATHLLYSMFWRISQKGSGEDVVVYRTLLEALCDNEEGQEALQILAKVLRKGLKAPKRGYKLIDLIHWQNGADTEDMKVLINEALIKGIVPSSDSYRAMAVDFYAESKIDEGNKVLKEMHDRGFKPSVGIYEAKVAALFRDGQVDEAIMVIDCEMVQKNCVPNIRLYNAVIKGICHERKSTTAIMYLERMSRQVGCVPNYETYETLVDGLCKDGKYVDGKKVMDQMSVHSFWPRVGTLNSLIQGLCQLDVCVVGVAGIPMGSFLGSLSSLPATKLGSVAIEGALKKANVDPSLVEEVFFGNVLSANLEQAPARQAALGAGIPNTVICMTVNKVCASGLKATMLAAQSIQLGVNEVVVAGGMESMSNVPKYIAEARKGSRLGHDSLVDGMLKDGLTDVYKDCGMGVCAEICAENHKITREEQFCLYICLCFYLICSKFGSDLNSTYQSCLLLEAEAFAWEIVPVEVPGGRGKPSIIVDKDDGLGKFDAAKLRKLRPSFKDKDGTVTAGNASSIRNLSFFIDGAAALVLVSGEKAIKLGLNVIAKISGYADAAQEPELFTTAPALAIPKAIKSASLEASQIDYYEINEAFAVVSLANQKLLGLNPEKVNVHGGAVSLGHPLGCSGARILVTLLGVLRQKNANMELLVFAMEEEVPQPLS